MKARVFCINMSWLVTLTLIFSSAIVIDNDDLGKIEEIADEESEDQLLIDLIDIGDLPMKREISEVSADLEIDSTSNELSDEDSFTSGISTGSIKNRYFRIEDHKRTRAEDDEKGNGIWDGIG